jgi:hypothetical protein
MRIDTFLDENVTFQNVKICGALFLKGLITT